MKRWWKKRSEPSNLKYAGDPVDPTDIQPTSCNLARVFPVLVSIGEAGKKWPGPLDRLSQVPFGVSWVETHDDRSWVTVDHHKAAFLAGNHPDWRGQAFANLRAACGHAASGDKDDEHGLPFIKILGHSDGLGPSRLLIPELFAAELGPDYQTAIPGSHYALAFRAKLSRGETADVRNMIGYGVRGGVGPRSARRYAASDFWHLARDSGW